MDRRAIAELVNDPLVRAMRETYLPRIVERYFPKEIWLFGSRVTDGWMESSGLDVLVLSTSFTETDDLARLSRFTREIELRDPIQCFCYTPEEFARETGAVREAMTYAVQIYPEGGTDKWMRRAPDSDGRAG